MSAKPNNFKLGLFTLIGAALLSAGILAFGAWSHLEKKSLFESYFPGDVNGLSVGSAVEFRGVRVGKVTHIGFSWTDYQDQQPGSIVVVFEIKDDVFRSAQDGTWRDQLGAAVAHGLRARLHLQGVTGTSIISLEYLDPVEYPPMTVAWTPSHPYVPSATGLLGDLLTDMHRALRKLDLLDVAALNQLAETDFKAAGKVLDRVGEVDFQNLSTNVVALLQDIRASSVKLNHFIDDTDGTVNKLQLQKLSGDADALVGQLRDTVGRLQPGLANLDVGAINQTLTQARETLGEIDAVLDSLKEYPSGFIFGAPPARIKELQRTNN